MEQSVSKYCFNLFDCTASEYLAAIRLTCAADRNRKKKLGTSLLLLTHPTCRSLFKRRTLKSNITLLKINVNTFAKNFQ